MKSYSEKYTKKIILKNGVEAFLRPIQDTDEDMLYELFKSCSYDTLFYRFMSSSLFINIQSGKIQLVMRIIKKYCCIDYKNQMSIIAIVKEKDKEKIASWGLYVKTSPNSADVAIMTADDWQRIGLASNIARFSIEIAKSNGIKFFEGEILLSNNKLLNLMKKLKIKYSRVIKHGSLHFKIDLNDPFYE
ncbi:MAG: hypothetical protein ACTSR3_03775 [Candidatus Helarchaeota archaeon]